MTAYPANDRSMLPAPPWKPEQVDDWEQAHGHDVRLDCALEGCEPLIADYEAVVEAAMYALGFMNDPEGLAHMREEWRDGLHASLVRLREAAPA